MVKTFLAFFLLFTPFVAVQAVTCEWYGHGVGPDQSGTIINIDKKTPACAKHSNNLPAQLCYGYAMCDFTKLVGTSEVPGSKDAQKLIEKKLSKNPTISDTGMTVAVCETSADGACPSADQCIFDKWRPGNPNRLAKGDQQSDAKKSRRFKKLNVVSVLDPVPDHPGQFTDDYYEMQTLDGLKAADSNQEVVVFAYEKGVNGKGVDGKPTHTYTSGGDAICLKQFSETLADCQKDACVDFADPQQKPAPFVPYSNNLNPSTQSATGAQKATP